MRFRPRPWPWRDLGIDATSDRQAIHEAYGRKVAGLGLGASAASFTRLTEARDAALLHAQAETSGIESNYLAEGSGEGAYYSEAAPLPSRLECARIWIVTIVLVGLLLTQIFGIISDAMGWRGEDGAWKITTDTSLGSRRIDAVVPELFGESFTPERLEQVSPVFAAGLGRDVSEEYGETDTERARSYLRASMMNSRAFLTRAELLQLSRLQLIWLRAARSQGGGACREVTGHSYFNGVPRLDGAALAEEQAIAREWVASIDFVAKGDDNPEPQRSLPAWAVTAVQNSTGLSPKAIDASLADLTDGNRCDVTIALLEALLARPADAPTSLLVSL